MKFMNNNPLTTGLIFLLLITTSFQSTFAQNAQSIDRVEPPFWWVGMKSQQLQLLVYGENISSLEPKIDFAGVTLTEVIRTENPNYLFIDLLISAEAKAGSFSIHFLSGKKRKLSHSYALKERRAGSAARQGFSNKDIIYLITPDRFANGNPSNDAVDGMREQSDRANKGGRHGGDIQGVIDNLDYIAEMGFTAIWLNPLLENNMEVYSYHGYSTTDYYKTDPRYGSNEDYLKLVEEARKKGILVIMDQIANHCGLFHWWTADPPTGDWYNFQALEEKPYSTHRRQTVVDPYSAEVDKIAHTDGWFVETMPDLNQRNLLLATYLIQNSIWWVEYAGLGGIRQDTYPYPDAEFMANWSCRLMEEYPNFNIVGEEWSLNPALVARWQRGKSISSGYHSCLPSLMDFPTQDALVKSLLKTKAPWSNTFDAVYEMLGNDFQYSEPYNLVSFLDNHDTPRFFDQVDDDLALFKMGLMHLYTSRGIPQLYYGTEILLNNSANESDHGLIRMDMPGGWENDAQNAFSGAGLSPIQLEAKEFFKTLTLFRRDTPALHNGDLMHYAPLDEVYVMFRWDEQSKVMTIFNKNEKEVTLDTKRYAASLAGAKLATDVLTSETYSLEMKNSIKVEPRSSLMLLIK